MKGWVGFQETIVMSRIRSFHVNISLILF